MPPINKLTWVAIKTAFRKHWPRKKLAQKTVEEYEDEITMLQLKMEDLGKKEKVSGQEVYSHIALADKMGMSIRGAKLENTTMYISQVRKELPRLLREKIRAGHADWTALLQAVHNLDINHIHDGIAIWKKEQADQDAIKWHIQQLEKLTTSPTALL